MKLSPKSSHPAENLLSPMELLRANLNTPAKLARLVFGETGPDAAIEQLGMDYRAAQGAAEDVPVLEQDELLREHVQFDAIKAGLIVLEAQAIQEARQLAKDHSIDMERADELFYGSGINSAPEAG